MTAKATIDDLFEKDERLDSALLARLERWEGRWRVALGLALAGLLFTPHFINSPDGAQHVILLILLWFLPIPFGLFMWLWPTWRAVPIGRRGPCIILALSVSLVAFSALPVAAAADRGPVVQLFLMVAAAAYALHRLNQRWKAQDEAEELFV
jgi:hypothetical protein